MAQNKLKITEKEFDSKKHVKEIKCTCNQCGKVWYYRSLEKTTQTMEEFSKDLMQSTACCCNPIGLLVGGLRKRPKKLDECPNCNSKNVKKETIYYKKK